VTAISHLKRATELGPGRRSRLMGRAMRADSVRAGPGRRSRLMGRAMRADSVRAADVK
jgi:hypothetical protein